MNSNKMKDYSNILLLKDFRIKYGFTQDEMAKHLDTTRSVVSMAEALRRPLSAEAEQLFLLLQEQLDALYRQSNPPAAGEDQLTAWRHQRKEAFAAECRGQYTSLRHQKMMLENEMAPMEEMAKANLSVIQQWERMAQLLHEGMELYPLAAMIMERCKQKLLTCDEAVQLTKTLQIKILSAGVDVLHRFMQEHGF